MSEGNLRAAIKDMINGTNKKSFENKASSLRKSPKARRSKKSGFTRSTAEVLPKTSNTDDETLKEEDEERKTVVAKGRSPSPRKGARKRGRRSKSDAEDAATPDESHNEDETPSADILTDSQDDKVADTTRRKSRRLTKS